MLTRKEELEQEAFEAGVRVEHISFQSDRIKGLYCDGSIAINKSVKESAEETCVLAEELGHYYTSSGIIIDLSEVKNRKQEKLARMIAYNKCVGLRGLINAYEHGCQNLHETAEFLDVTECFLTDALESYRKKFGIYTMVDNYIVYFEPSLKIGKII